MLAIQLFLNFNNTL